MGDNTKVSVQARTRMHNIVMKILNGAGHGGMPIATLAQQIKEHPSSIQTAWKMYRCNTLAEEGLVEILNKNKTYYVRRINFDSTITPSREPFPFKPLTNAFQGQKIIRRDSL